ncbi:MAG: HEAT repeat domain-containing protein [Isosphaeraceae bacterium]|nr:HEAT repeat domain-containing protein [Isosphaeraceae bacterium]
MDDSLSTRRALAPWLTIAALTAPQGCAALNPVGTTATNILRHAQSDPDPNVRYLAYSKLGSANVYDNEEQKREVLRVLVKRLEFSQEPVASRAMICRTLGELRLPEAHDALLKAVDDNDAIIRVEACRALGKVGRPEDATVLCRVMTVDTLLDAKIAAIDGLAALKPKDPRILQVLVEGMDNDLPAIRLSSVQALRAITGKDLGVEPKPWRELVQPMLAQQPSAAADAAVQPVGTTK